MGFSFSDLGEALNPFDKSNPVFGKGGVIDEAARGFDDAVLGRGAARAAEEAAAVQAEAGREAAALQQPFVDLGLLGTERAGFLLDPQAQFDFIQNNPFFDLGLQNLNRQTAASAAASGRTGATDTQSLLFNNALLSSLPLLDRQTGAISDFINLGQSAAANQGNLLTGIGAAEAGGIVGAANARQQGIGNLFNLAGTIGGLALGGAGAGAAGAGAGGIGAGGIGAGAGALLPSDSRLKENIKHIGTENGHKKYKWTWNKLAENLGLVGESTGVIAQEVEKTHPNAVSVKNGFKHVNYSLIGVSHGY